MYFKTLYKLYKFLFLVNSRQIKSWRIVKWSIDLAATNSKKSVYIIHERCFFQNFVAESLGCVFCKNRYGKYNNYYKTEIVIDIIYRYII